ncbi:MAG: YggS family pyridoxal phosphate-dependent enzyme [Gammaproteobacteria bacterium]|nr:MAG: YggS family pyridoxal phosphate-dependent enzyme [Gammaproteobacteria bacterium]
MIKDNLADVYQQIERACKQANRSADSVKLIAVSKKHGVAKIRTAYALGQRDFGENYLNEALEKQAQLNDLSIHWHFIGHIQSNKTRKIAEHFDWVHTVDSLKIARRLSTQRPPNLAPINICLQINIDNEDSKSGLAEDIDHLLSLAKSIAELPHIKLRGLMCIPKPKADKQQEIDTFSRMKALQRVLNDNGVRVDTLSMGMSDDLQSAIECGATIVRVGTAIFGKRM